MSVNPMAFLPTLSDVVSWWDWRSWVAVGAVVIMIAVVEGAVRKR